MLYNLIRRWEYLDVLIRKDKFSILVGKRIRELREVRSISQLQLSTDIEIDESTLRNYESGRQIPSIYTLYKISYYLGIT